MFSKVIGEIKYFLLEEMWTERDFRPTAALIIGTIVLLPIILSSTLSACSASKHFELVPTAVDTTNGRFQCVTEYHVTDEVVEYGFTYINDEGSYSTVRGIPEDIKIVGLEASEKRPYVTMNFTENGEPDLDSIVVHADELDINIVYPSPSLEKLLTPNNDSGPGPGPVSY